MARVESDLEGVCKLKTIAHEEEEAPDVEQGVGREKKPVTYGTHHFSLKDKCDPSAGWSSVISRHLYILVVPGVMFCLIVALCSFGIVHATEASYNTEAKQAREAAVSAADGIAKQLSSASRAALSLAAVFRMNPNWSFLESNFEVLAQELFRQSAEEEGDLSLKELALIPFGRVTANYGTIHGGNHGDGNHGDGNNDDGNHVKGNNDQSNSTGNNDHGNHVKGKNDQSNSTGNNDHGNHGDGNNDHGNHGDGNNDDGNHGDGNNDGHTIDLFSPERIEETGPYRSMEQHGLTVSGPIPFAGTQERAFAARYPVFFNDTDEDESWGHPDNITHPTGCSGPPCYDPATRKKFWGFIGGVVSADPLLRGDNVHLKRLLSDDLSYSLTTSFLAGTGGPGNIVSGGPSPEKVTANVSVNLPGTSWDLSVYNPRLEEIVHLRKGLLAMVVVVACILSVMLFLLLLSSKRASVYLQEQLVTNKQLQEEKVSREALLSR